MRSSWLALAMKSARICSARFQLRDVRRETRYDGCAVGGRMVDAAKRARSWRSTGTVKEKSITRALSPPQYRIRYSQHRGVAQHRSKIAGLGRDVDEDRRLCIGAHDPPPLIKTRSSGYQHATMTACAAADFVGYPDALTPEPGEPSDREPDLARYRSEPASHLPRDGLAILVQARGCPRRRGPRPVGNGPADGTAP